MSTQEAPRREDPQRGGEEPLSDKDIQQLTRYLSDPTVFPREFKRWITEHSSDTVDISKSQVHGLINDSGQVMIGSSSMGVLGATMTGVILPYAGPQPPPGWLICNGAELLRTEYVALHKIIGTLWGTPSTGDHFKLPDLRGRAPYGQDSNVPFGDNDRIPAGSRGPRHHHHVTQTATVNVGGSGQTAGDGTHQHGGMGGVTVDPAGNGNALWAGGGFLTDAGNSFHSHAFSFSGSGSASIDTNTTDAAGPRDVVGWVGLNYIIGSGKLP